MTTTEFTAQKALAKTLDRIAARGSNGATSKQCWYLAGLLIAAGQDADDMLLDTGYRLTVREASSLIDTLKN
jgi:hypothetical protein